MLVKIYKLLINELHGILEDKKADLEEESEYEEDEDAGDDLDDEENDDDDLASSENKVDFCLTA